MGYRGKSRKKFGKEGQKFRGRFHLQGDRIWGRLNDRCDSGLSRRDVSEKVLWRKIGARSQILWQFEVLPKILPSRVSRQAIRGVMAGWGGFSAWKSR